jgi:hypothetical protein
MINQWMFAAGVSLLTMTLLRRLYRKQKRKSKHEDDLEKLKKLNAPGEYRMDRVQQPSAIDLYEFSREVNAQIDTKLVLLEASIDTAREEQEKLQDLIEQVQQLQKTPES